MISEEFIVFAIVCVTIIVVFLTCVTGCFGLINCAKLCNKFLKFNSFLCYFPMIFIYFIIKKIDLQERYFKEEERREKIISDRVFNMV